MTRAAAYRYYSYLRDPHGPLESYAVGPEAHPRTNPATRDSHGSLFLVFTYAARRT